MQFRINGVVIDEFESIDYKATKPLIGCTTGTYCASGTFQFSSSRKTRRFFRNLLKWTGEPHPTAYGRRMKSEREDRQCSA